MCTFKLIFQSAFSTPLPLKAHKSLLLLSSNYYFATSHFRYCLPIITRKTHENSTRNEFPSVATLSRLLCSDGKDHNNCIEVHDSLMQQRWGQVSYYCLIIQFGFHAGVCHVSHVPVQVSCLLDLCASCILLTLAGPSANVVPSQGAGLLVRILNLQWVPYVCARLKR